MAKAALKKIRITGFKAHYKLLMQELHRSGTLQIVENSELLAQSKKQYDDHYGVFDLARVEFALDFLKPMAKRSSKIESILAGGKLVLGEEAAKNRLKDFAPKSEAIIEECEQIEDRLVRLKNEIEAIPVKKRLIENMSNFEASVSDTYQTSSTMTWIGKIPQDQFESFQQEVSGESNLVDLKVLGKLKKMIFIRLTVWNELAMSTQQLISKYAFEAINLHQEFSDFEGKSLKTINRELDANLANYQTETQALKAKAQELAVHVDDLKVLYDFNAWRKTKNDLQQKIYLSDQVFAFEAWAVADALPDLKKWIKNIFVGEVSLEEIEVTEGEEAPVLLKNKWGVKFFEPVVEMYGLPRMSEFDPTPFITPFFFVFFGLCLSDTGYGSILLLVSTWFLLFSKFGQAARNSLWLIFLCGIAAIIGGIVLGGHFGLTPEQAPYLVNPETGAFYGQLLNPMEGSGPILFLSLALGLGAVQLLTGLVVDFFQRMSNKDTQGAFLHSGAWFFFIASLLLFGLSSVESVATNLSLDKALMSNVAIASAVVLFVAQSIAANVQWFLKPLFGLISLYNATSYLSDLLSYSRIMALGLATGVVGFAMNMTAGILGGMMPHWTLSLVIGVIVIVFGHTLNFGLSLLGAFIHSGRLQFIEFFGKFYEGGGNKFQPFIRETKYLNIEK